VSASSDIEWTDATWNPVRGCIKVSPGCKHCYAEAFAERFRFVKGHPYEQGFDPRLVPEKLDEPLRWKRGRRIFVNSMSDLFGDFVPVGYLAAVFGVMGLAGHHTFQVLTKRASRLAAIVTTLSVGSCLDWTTRYDVNEPRAALRHQLADLAVRTRLHPTAWPLPNVHLGVSVESATLGVRVERVVARKAASVEASRR
jgi:protein gp37